MSYIWGVVCLFFYMYTHICSYYCSLYLFLVKKLGHISLHIRLVSMSFIIIILLVFVTGVFLLLMANK